MKIYSLEHYSMFFKLNIQNSPKNQENYKCSKIKLKNKLSGNRIDFSL